MIWRDLVVTRLAVLLWAVAEGTFWPIMPDAILVPLALRRPASWWQLVTAAALGTATGGAVSYVLGRRRPERERVSRLPLVRPAMVAAAADWLMHEGARGVWRQPATGIPFKVFARLAGARQLPPGRFLLWAILARSARFTLAAGLAALVGRRWPSLRTGRWWWLTLLVWWAAFGAALWRLVSFWGRRDVRPRGLLTWSEAQS